MLFWKRFFNQPPRMGDFFTAEMLQRDPMMDLSDPMRTSHYITLWL